MTSISIVYKHLYKIVLSPWDSGGTHNYDHSETRAACSYWGGDNWGEPWKMMKILNLEKNMRETSIVRVGSILEKKNHTGMNV